MAERDSSGSTTPKQATTAQVVGLAVRKPRQKSTIPFGSATLKQDKQHAQVVQTLTPSNASPVSLIDAVCLYFPQYQGEVTKKAGPGTGQKFAALTIAMNAVNEAIQATRPEPEATESISTDVIITKLNKLIDDMLVTNHGSEYLNDICKFAFNRFVILETRNCGYFQPKFEIIAENIRKCPTCDNPPGETLEEQQREFIRLVFTYLAPHIFKAIKSTSQ